jgi:hypothetical protein
VLRLLREALRPAGFAAAFALLGLRRTIHRLPAGLLAVAIEAAVTAAISTTVAAIIVAVAVTALVAPERTIVPVLAAVVLALRLERLRLRLMHGDLRHLREIIAAGVIALIVTELVAALAAFAHALAIAVQAIALLTHLLAIGHDDAAVVLGVLEIVLRQYRIAGRLRISRKRDIFLGNMRRSTANFYIRAVGFKAPRQRIVVVTTALAVVVPAAAAPVLLSLPHCP